MVGAGDHKSTSSKMTIKAHIIKDINRSAIIIEHPRGRVWFGSDECCPEKKRVGKSTPPIV